MKLFSGFTKLFKFGKKSATGASAQASPRGKAVATNAVTSSVVTAPAKDTVQIAAKSAPKKPLPLTPDQISALRSKQPPAIPPRKTQITGKPLPLTPDQASARLAESSAKGADVPAHLVEKMRKPLPQIPVKKGTVGQTAQQSHSTKRVSDTVEPSFDSLMKRSDEAIASGKAASEKLQRQVSEAQQKLQPQLEAQYKQHERISDLLSRPLNSTSSAPSRVRVREAHKLTSSTAQKTAASSSRTALLEARKGAHENFLKMSSELNKKMSQATDPKQFQLYREASALNMRKYNAVKRTASPQEATRLANMKLSEFRQFEKQMGLI